MRLFFFVIFWEETFLRELGLGDRFGCGAVNAHDRDILDQVRTMRRHVALGRAHAFRQMGRERVESKSPRTSWAS